MSTTRVTAGQVLGGIVIVGGVLVGANTQLHGLGLSDQAVTFVVSLSGLAVAICGAFITKFQGLSSQAQAVAAPGNDTVVLAGPNAPPGIQAAAKDTSIANVQPVAVSSAK